MFLREIQVPVSRVRGVGPATAGILHGLGLTTVGELLSWWPRDWDDRTVLTNLSRAEELARIHLSATVIAHDWFGFGRMRTLKLVIEDGEGTTADLVCFNRPFLEKSFPPGTAVSVHGSFQRKYGNLQSSAFEIEPEGSGQSRVIPVYPLCAGISQSQMRKIIANALREYGRGIDSELPESVRAAERLPPKPEILRMMHDPVNLESALRAKNALIFEELFLFEYAIGQRSLERRGKLPDVAAGESAGKPREEKDFVPLSPLQARLVERLPFSLTPDQRSVLDELDRDIGSDSVMARLLQGDVGSGKTLVAFLACLRVIDEGGQCALMAPTELLARQHAENAARMLEPVGVRLAFLTGNLKSTGRSQLLARLAAGEIDLVIGTHALFSGASATATSGSRSSTNSTASASSRDLPSSGRQLRAIPKPGSPTS